MKTTKFQYDGLISFGKVLDIYKKTICIGFKPLSFYSLTAENHETNMILETFKHFNDDEFSVSIVEDKKVLSLIEGLESFLRGALTYEPEKYQDPILNKILKREPPGNYGRWNIYDFVNLEIDEVETFKQSVPISHFELHEDTKIIGVKNRMLHIEKENDLNLIRLEADSTRDLRVFEYNVLKILNQKYKN